MSLDSGMQTYRLALFLTQHLAEVILVFLKSISEGENCLLALLEGDLGPLLEGLLASLDGIVNILLGCDGNFWVGLAGGRVDTVAGLLGGGQFAIDGVLEIGEDVEGGAHGTHDCGIEGVSWDSKTSSK
jgi:hypothetical protein